MSKKIRLVRSLQQLRTFANTRCSRLCFRGLIPEIIFKGIVTNLTICNLQLLFRSCFEQCTLFS